MEAPKTVRRRFSKALFVHPLIWFLAAFAGSVPEAEGATVRYPLRNFTEIYAIVFTSDGAAWVSSSEGILRIQANGSATTVADVEARPMTVGPDGAVWAATREQLLRIDAVSGAIQRFDSAEWIWQLGTGPDGMLWSLTEAGNLVRWNTAGEVVSNSPTAAPRSYYYSPRFVAGGDSMWTVGGNGLVRVAASGAIETFSLPMPSPFWVAAADDFLWISNIPNIGNTPRTTVRVAFDGRVLSQYEAPVSYVMGVATDRAGNLLMSEEYTGAVVRLAPDGTATHLAAFPKADVPCSFGGPEPIAVATDGRIAIGSWVYPDAISPPDDPCRTDPGAQSMVTIFDPAQAQEIPTAARSVLLSLSLIVAVAGIVQLRNR